MTENREVRVNCSVEDRVNYRKLVPIQGDLKSLSTENYEKLKASILEHGIHTPQFVWSHEGELKILDGTQRRRTYETMENDGFKIPPVPVVRVHADTEGQARRMLLTMVSQYGRVERQGLYEYVTSAGIGPGELAEKFQLPDLNIPTFNAEYFLDTVGTSGKAGATEYGSESFDKFDHKCPRCGFSFD